MTMKYVLGILIILALLAVEAHAGCITNTIFGQNGSVIMCTTCCTGHMCTTQCFDELGRPR